MAWSGRGPRKTASERAYGALLFLYPKDFRRDYGPRMVQAFGDLCRDEYGRAGSFGLLLLWAHTVLDLLRTAVSERTWTVPGEVFVIPYASSPKMVRWGGAAAVAGGLCALGAMVLSDISLIYVEEPIRNALWRYEDGAEPYSPLILLFHPVVFAFLGTLSSLLFAVAFLGLYAVVSRRSGKAVLGAGILVCLWAATLAVAAGSDAYRLSADLSGELGAFTSSPLLPLIEVASLASLAGSLILSIAVLRTKALARWSVLPLALFPLGPLVTFLLLYLGHPVSNAPQALAEGIGTLIITDLPSISLYGGWLLLGFVMLRSSREASQGMPAEQPLASRAGD